MKSQKEQITYPNLPLAIYREIAAHLRQIKDINTELIPQKSQQFDYAQSQVDSLHIHYRVNFDSSEKQQVKAILDYYAQRYGAYERNVLDS
ncbi:hypothetical protein [Aphanothece sacrum]|uniref:3-ketoacyl-ACP reductase n=1 Tax=Aphanothece sacrum FPU1 TaxID=1920663 RepID=A0A401IBM1_APHSA|nr:hypothetical protein [Aphanothece sacrum]GBF78673.1 3-ketoacyl-ACP reductase [Aphanothece sacrum FPU1]GBF84962.1 3-ketoacyl-ACP reductase [Aphanothece sacrum FPU3]